MKLKKVAPPANPKPVIVPSPSDLTEFQRAYASEWMRIATSPAFLAALQLLNIRKLNGLTALTNEQIERNGREILSDLRGHLQHENDLVTLHSKEDFTIPFEEPDEYFSQEQIEEMEQVKEKFREEQKRARYG